MSDCWTLLTSHGYVLFFVAAEPDATIRRISDILGLSERRVASILHDLESAGMLRATRAGRRKHYAINPDAKFRHPALSHVPLREVMGPLHFREPSGRAGWRRSSADGMTDSRG